MTPKEVAKELARSLRFDVGRWHVIYGGGSSTKILHSIDGLFVMLWGEDVQFGSLHECRGNEHRGTKLGWWEARDLRKAIREAVERRTPAMMHAVTSKLPRREPHPLKVVSSA